MLCFLFSIRQGLPEPSWVELVVNTLPYLGGLNRKQMENKPEDYHTILQKIIIKGGLMGSCAKMYINDEELAKQLIYELSEMCKSEYYCAFLGDDLVNDIKGFVLIPNDIS